MLNYDLEILSPIEFENLSRDLLQSTFNIQLESFSEGKDLGIDFRCLKTNSILQCKRISSKSNLLSSLKSEVANIHTLKPTRYFITTSLSLSVQKKNQILALFAAQRQIEVVVLGKEDLNNLIGQYPHLEIKYYKLWLSSTNILQKILNNKLYNLNKFGREKIKKKLRVYVQNKSLNQALKILEENNYIIISGIPGIGKTTLADIVSYTLLARGYEELVYINDNVDVGFEGYNEEKSQIFLHDDFLGRNFLRSSLDKNEDKKLLEFIELINSTKNKKLILTTREYILNQAQIEYEILKRTEFSKYILDLEKYSVLDKAKILYNHFYFSELPYDFIESLLENKKIFAVINHHNYSPRIIETLSTMKSWQNKEPATYADYVISLLDNPYEIWEHAFERDISSTSRFILKNLLLNQKVTYSSLYIIVKHNMKCYLDIGIETHDFKNSIKELGNCFVKLEIVENNQIIDFYNPSIHDFLVHYVNKKKELLYESFDNIYFINKVSQIFSFQKAKGKIYIDKESEPIFHAKIIGRIDEMKIYFDSENEDQFTQTEVELIKLINIDKIFRNPPKEFFAFAKKIIELALGQERLHNKITESYLKLFIKYADQLNLNKNRFVIQISEDKELTTDLWIIEQLSENFPTQFKKYIEPEIESILRPVIEKLYLSISYDNDKNYLIKKELEEIAEYYKIDVEFELTSVKDQIAGIKAEEARIMFDEYDNIMNSNISRSLFISHANETSNKKSPDEKGGKVQIKKPENNEELQILEMFEKLKNR